MTLIRERLDIRLIYGDNYGNDCIRCVKASLHTRNTKKLLAVYHGNDLNVGEIPFVKHSCDVPRYMWALYKIDDYYH